MSNTGRFKSFIQDAAPQRGGLQTLKIESVAMTLRNARILQGYSLNEVSNTIHIQMKHLEAIEGGQFDALPPVVYAKGFIAAYATFLQLDQNEIVNQFCHEILHANDDHKTSRIHIKKPSLKIHHVDDPAERNVPSGTLIVIGLVLMVVCYGLWQMTGTTGRHIALNVPPLPARFQTLDTPTPATPPLVREAALSPAPLTTASATSYDKTEIVNNTSDEATIGEASIAETPDTALPVTASNATPDATTSNVLPTPSAGPSFASPSTPAVNSQQVNGTASASGAAPATAAKALVTVQVLAESPVQIYSLQGDLLADTVLHPGEVYSLPVDGSSYILKTKRLDILSIKVNGQSSPLTADKSQEQYNILMEPTHLLNGTAVY